MRVELRLGWLSGLDHSPVCSHNIFWVKKSVGDGYRLVVDCSKPAAKSVNSYVGKVSQTFPYKAIDDLVNHMALSDFITLQIYRMPIGRCPLTRLIVLDSVKCGILDRELNCS